MTPDDTRYDDHDRNDTRPILPPPAYETRAPERSARRGRGGFAAGVLATALLLGAGAGVGGAAAWEEWGSDDSLTGETGTSGTETSQVVDSDDSPAPDGSVEQVAADVLPSVVKINVAGEVQGQQATGSGSGIVLSDDGAILTNAHVVEVAQEGGRISVSFDDGSRAAAEVVGTDPLTDTAVIQADGVEGLTPATIGSSGNLDVGQEVVAVGSPFGLDATVTSGIVSALDRPVSVGRDEEGNSTTYPAVQTDAAINPGNSGGPLVNMSGEVVGINSSIRTASSSPVEEGGSIGLGFAIPIDEVMPIVDQLLAGETPTHARLGITVSDVPPQESDELIPEGAFVREVTEESSASEAGLEPEDVITRVDDTPIAGADSLVATTRSYRPGDEVTVTFLRDGEEQTTTLTLDSDAE